MGANREPWYRSKRTRTVRIRPASISTVMDADKLIELVEEQYHKPYKLRPWTVRDIYDLDPDDFDCSSLVMWAYFRLGYKLPRTSLWQYNFCDRVKAKELKKGDLFFLARFRKPAAVNHVGIYAGAGMCYEAAGGRAKKVIRSFVDRISQRRDFLGWGRVPLEKAQDDFFAWVKKHPNKVTSGGFVEVIK